MQQFSFAEPRYLYLLIPAAGAVYAFYRRRHRPTIAFSAPFYASTPRRTWRIAGLQLATAALFLALATMVGAAAGPRLIREKVARTAEAVAIAMVLDVSGSMQALDVPSGTNTMSRLEAVKAAFADFVKRRPNDLIGLVTFGGYAKTVAPLTLDHSALLNVLASIQIPGTDTNAPAYVPDEHELLTAIGDGLALGCARLRRAAPKSKVLVLLSDGESNTGVVSPEQAAQLARQLGIRIYTIGVGTPGVVPYATSDESGRSVVAYDEAGYDEECLKKIAQTTAGCFFGVRDLQGLQETIREIDMMEKTTIRKFDASRRIDLSPLLVWTAICLVAAATTFNVVVAGRVI